MIGGARGLLDARRPRVPGAVIVKFREPAGAGLGPQAAAAIADHRMGYARAIPSLGLHVLDALPGDELEAARRLQTDPRVAFAEPDYLFHRASHLIPTDSLYASEQQNLRVIGMPDAWDVTVGSGTVTVAIIDTGIDFNHPDLDTRIKSLTGPGLPGADHVFLTPISSISFPACVALLPDDDGYRASSDPFAHGTHVAGIAAARSSIAGDPATGVAGIAPAVRVAPLKALDCAGDGRFSDIATAIAFAADHGARVVNLSLASTGDDSTCAESVQTAVDAAYARGVLVVAAAGNDGNSDRTIPAVCAHVVGVGATDNADNRASFSQANSTVDLVAPGVGIVGPVRLSDGTRAWQGASGTSMATAHVTGCAALLWSAEPSLGVDHVEAALRGTALDLGPFGRDDLYGAGRLRCGAAMALVASAPATPTATPTRTATSTSLSTASAMPTATPSPTPASSPTSGFTLQSLGSGSVRLSWPGGPGGSSYGIVRVDASGSRLVAAPTPPATSFVDTIPAGQFAACYVLVVTAGGATTTSSFLCTVQGIASGSGPNGVSVRLDPATLAQLAWTAPGGQSDYLLVPLGTARVQVLPGGATAATDPTGGQPVCYLVAARANAVVIGYADPVCAIPTGA